VLLRASKSPLLAGGVVDYGLTLDQVTSWAQEEAEKYLLIKRAEIIIGLQVTIESAEGAAAPCIEAYIRNRQAGLLVIASLGRGWLGQLLLGSVAQAVLAQPFDLTELLHLVATISASTPPSVLS
jgi:nucleotide-binding universal stress UspA family protein